jgi:hypothetical protein
LNSRAGMDLVIAVPAPVHLSTAVPRMISGSRQ